jgi:hypothetical protein
MDYADLCSDCELIVKKNLRNGRWNHDNWHFWWHVCVCIIYSCLMAFLLSGTSTRRVYWGKTKEHPFWPLTYTILPRNIHIRLYNILYI